MTETKPMNRIMINGPKEDGTYVVEFKTAAGEALPISRAEKRSHRAQALPARMPYRLVVPDVDAIR